MKIEFDEYRIVKIWEEGFDAAAYYYDWAINEMHRALHPDESLWYTKCYQTPCKNL